MTLNRGEEVWFLSEYQWVRAIVQTTPKSNSKTVKLGGVPHYPQGYTFRVNIEKIAKPDEVVCVVWETWRGKNGRGGYRVERELYPEARMPAKDLNRNYDYYQGAKAFVTEKEYGVLDLRGVEI